MSGLRVEALKLSFLSLCLLAVAGIIPAHGSGGVTVVVKEGSDAVLPCSLSTKENISAKIFDWRKVAQKDDGRKEVFMYNAGRHYNNNGQSGQSEEFKGRVSHFPEELQYGNASITIRNTKLTDSGDYTCDFPRLQRRQTFHIKLVVEPILKDRSGENPAVTPEPYIKIVKATEDWVLLQCDVRGASPEPHLQWQDSAGNKLPAEEPQVSEREGRHYITLKTNVTKSDHYRCVVTQQEINHQTHEETDVFIRAATPKPSVRRLNATEDWALLQCDVRGASSEPHLQWQDSAGNKLPAEELQVSEREGRYNVTLNTRVTKSDRYRCVVTQQEISHQTHAEAFVFIRETVCEDSSSKVAAGWFGGLVLGAVAVVAVQALLVATKSITVGCNRGSRMKANGSCNQENGLCKDSTELPLRSPDV